MTNTQEAIARKTPLVELLAAVPADARLVVEELDGNGTHYIPIGALCSEAIAALQPAAASTQYAINRAIQLCEWIAETPHQRGSINGLAAQVRHELSALQPAAASTQASEPVAIVQKAATPSGFPQGGHTQIIWLTDQESLPQGHLYAAPARAVETLTDEKLLSMWSGGDERFLRPVLGKNKVLAFARAIERAHGIGIPATTPTKTQGGEA